MPPSTGPIATARAGDRAEYAEGRPPLLAVERLGDQRQRGGEHHRPAGALYGAREVQHQRRGRQAADG